MSDNTPLVSVVMPNYNNEKFLPDAIRSIQQQTLDDHELVIYHDPSEDNSLQVLQDFSSKDQRINLILGEKKINAAHGFNMAIDNACGKYIFVMDSDNIMAPELLQRSVDFMAANPEITMLSSTYRIFGKKEILAERASCHSLIAVTLIKECSFDNAFMARREFFNQAGLRYDENLAIACDYKLFIDAMLHNEHPAKFAIMDYVGIHYRMHDANLSPACQPLSAMGKICPELVAVCDHISEKLYPRDGDYEMLRNILQYNMNNRLMRLYDCGIDSSYVTPRNVLLWRNATIRGLNKYQDLDISLVRAELNRCMVKMVRRKLKSLLLKKYHVNQSVGNSK